jgi:hypothetical protein
MFLGESVSKEQRLFLDSNENGTYSNHCALKQWLMTGHVHRS